LMHKLKLKNKVAKGKLMPSLKNGSWNKGLYEILTKQTEKGIIEVVSAAGGDNKKRSIIINWKLPELVRTQVSRTVKNIKIDKITVWDSGNTEITELVQLLTLLLEWWKLFLL
jgi:hypothetical protein